MSSQHRHPNRNYRPSADEYDGARAVAAAHGANLNVLIRAFLRILIRSPERTLRFIAADLKAVVRETPKGRPRKGEDG